MRRLTLLVALLGLLGVAMPLSAQESDINEARERREEIKKEAAENAAALDVLAAEDAEIVAALAEIDSYIALQEARLEGAQQELSAARESEALALARVAELDADIDGLRDLIAEQSVNAYVLGTDIEDAILNADNVTDAAYVRYLVQDVNGVGVDLTDVLRVARAEQEDAQAAAAGAAETATEAQDQINARLEELAESRKAQEVIRVEIEARIEQNRSGECVARSRECPDRRADRCLRRGAAGAAAATE